MTLRRVISVLAVVLASFLAADLTAQTFCAKPKPVPQPPPPDPYPPICEPKKCDKCSKSPCYLATGAYVNEFVDLQIPTAGMYPLTVSRRYDSSRPTDGPLGVGWSTSLTARLYYATYLKSAPSTYSYEADVVMPDGVLYKFTINGNGAFTAPLGRYDTLVRNGDDTFSLTLQHTRSVYRFNADGSLSSLTDDYGNVINYTYDAQGHVETMADTSGSGRYINVTWALDGRIASMADNSGRVLKYFYETGDGTLTSFSDPIASNSSSQRSAYFSYVPSRFAPVLSRIEDRWHRLISELEWYPNGKLKSYTEGSFNAANPASSEGEKYTYSYFGNGATKNHSLGGKSYPFSPNGLVNDQVTYDGLGQPISVPGPTGVVTNYTYDARGNVRTSTINGVTWTYAYDTTFPDNVLSVIASDPNWGGWAYEYNPAGSTAAGALARVLRIRTDATTRDQVAKYVYDAHGRVTSVTDDNLFLTSYAYNAAEDLVAVTRGTLTTTYEYDALGRQTSVTTPDSQKTSFTYDVLDRIASVTLPKPTASSPLNFVTTYSYDDYDSVTGLVFTNVTDPNGRITRTGYDAPGHVVQAIDAAGNRTQFVYQYGLLKKVRDANDNETSYSYNASRDLTATTFPDGAAETYYTSNGTVLAKTDRNGHRFAYAYDGFARLSSVTVDYYSMLASYTYTGQKLTRIQDPTTTFQYTYDTSWRRASEEVVGGEKIIFTYRPMPVTGFSSAGSLLESYAISPPAGSQDTTRAVMYLYDGNGRISYIIWNWTASGFAIDYHPNGQYSRITYPNGQSRTFAYDNQARLTNITNTTTAGQPLASFDYGYDHNWATGMDTILGQRTSVTVTGSSGFLENGMTKYWYDDLYQLTRADYPNVNHTYEAWTYDAIGNRTTWRPPAGSLTAYTYYKNGANAKNGQRLRHDGAGSPRGVIGPDFTYDANGNVTATTTASGFTWDSLNRLTSFGGATYAYDYLGRRKSVTRNGSTTRYISLGMHTVGERNTTTGVSTDYLFAPGIDEPLAKRTANGAVSYYAVDGLGSISLVTDSTGAVTSSFAYSPWGESLGTTSELFGYTGRENGALAWFYRARYYDAARGRFISEDPLGEHLAGNPLLSSHLSRTYAYVENDPLLRRDPLGLKSCGPLPPCGNGVPCGQCCAQRFQWGLCGVETTFHYSHVVELGVTVAFAAAGAVKGGATGAIIGAGIGLGASYAYLHYLQIAAEQAVRNAYQHCVDQCKNDRLLACNLPPPPPHATPF
ncbi:MAG: RHS repeat-associated core domain-containing protein [Acidobacteriota bacterium]